jgi:P27 family predicted phage terminase small subunit
MGKRGPKPKPTSLRVFEGDPGRLLKNRQGEPLPSSSEAVPLPPPWLAANGLEAWGKYAPKLHAIGLLTGVDYEQFSQYCAAHDHFHAADKAVKELGNLIRGAMGGLVANPAVRQRRDAQQAIRQLGGDFGLSPASRVGLKVTSDKKVGGLAAFKNKA